MQGQDWWLVLRVSDAIHHLTFATPPPPSSLSNQLVLICYNRGPSGPYYSNPCDVIPKWHCFHCSLRRTICYLTSPKGRPRSSYFFCSAVPSPSVTVAQRGQRTRPHTDFTVGSLHQQQACSQSLCSFKQYTGFAGLTEAASRTVSVSKTLKTLSGCETVTGSVRCTACRHAQKKQQEVMYHLSVWAASNAA